VSAIEHTVLAVDDEEEVVEPLRRALRRQPYRFIGVTSPLAALAQLEAGGVDVLIADIDMPEMSGIELVRRVRAAHPDVVRILLTGDASLESAMAAINEGEVHRFLTKPWDKEELRDTIRGALDRIEELRRTASAAHRVQIRDQLLAELEAEHPGIRDVELTDGVYVIDEEKVRATAQSATTALRTLVEPVEPQPAPGVVRSITRRIK